MRRDHYYPACHMSRTPTASNISYTKIIVIFHICHRKFFDSLAAAAEG